MAHPGDQLPLDAWRVIVSYLPSFDIKVLRLSCRRFRQLALEAKPLSINLTTTAPHPFLNPELLALPLVPYVQMACASAAPVSWTALRHLYLTSDAETPDPEVDLPRLTVLRHLTHIVFSRYISHHAVAPLLALPRLRYVSAQVKLHEVPALAEGLARLPLGTLIVSRAVYDPAESLGADAQALYTLLPRLTRLVRLVVNRAPPPPADAPLDLRGLISLTSLNFVWNQSVMSQPHIAPPTSLRTLVPCPIDCTSPLAAALPYVWRIAAGTVTYSPTPAVSQLLSITTNLRTLVLSGDPPAVAPLAPPLNCLSRLTDLTLSAYLLPYATLLAPLCARVTKLQLHGGSVDVPGGNLALFTRLTTLQLQDMSDAPFLWPESTPPLTSLVSLAISLGSPLVPLLGRAFPCLRRLTLTCVAEDLPQWAALTSLTALRCLSLSFTQPPYETVTSLPPLPLTPLPLVRHLHLADAPPGFLPLALLCPDATDLSHIPQLLGRNVHRSLPRVRAVRLGDFASYNNSAECCYERLDTAGLET